MKPYQNIVTDKIVSYDRYMVIADYDTREEAERNYEADVNRWTEENRSKLWYKLSYPFAYATICDRELVY